MRERSESREGHLQVEDIQARGEESENETLRDQPFREQQDEQDQEKAERSASEDDDASSSEEEEEEEEDTDDTDDTDDDPSEEQSASEEEGEGEGEPHGSVAPSSSQGQWTGCAIGFLHASSPNYGHSSSQSSSPPSALRKERDERSASLSDPDRAHRYGQDQGPEQIRGERDAAAPRSRGTVLSRSQPLGRPEKEPSVCTQAHPEAPNTKGRVKTVSSDERKKNAQPVAAKDPKLLKLEMVRDVPLRGKHQEAQMDDAALDRMFTSLSMLNARPASGERRAVDLRVRPAADTAATVSSASSADTLHWDEKRTSATATTAPSSAEQGLSSLTGGTGRVSAASRAQRGRFTVTMSGSWGHSSSEELTDYDSPRHTSSSARARQGARRSLPPSLLDEITQHASPAKSTRGVGFFGGGKRKEQKRKQKEKELERQQQRERDEEQQLDSDAPLPPRRTPGKRTKPRAPSPPQHPLTGSLSASAGSTSSSGTTASIAEAPPVVPSSVRRTSSEQSTTSSESSKPKRGSLASVQKRKSKTPSHTPYTPSGSDAAEPFMLSQPSRRAEKRVASSRGSDLGRWLWSPLSELPFSFRRIVIYAFLAHSSDQSSPFASPFVGSNKRRPTTSKPGKSLVRLVRIGTHIGGDESPRESFKDTSIPSTTNTATTSSGQAHEAPRARPHTVNVAVAAPSSQKKASHLSTSSSTDSLRHSNSSSDTPGLRRLISLLPSDSFQSSDVNNLLRIPFWISNTRFALLELAAECTAGEITKLLVTQLALKRAGHPWTANKNPVLCAVAVNESCHEANIADVKILSKTERVADVLPLVNGSTRVVFVMLESVGSVNPQMQSNVFDRWWRWLLHSYGVRLSHESHSVGGASSSKALCTDATLIKLTELVVGEQLPSFMYKAHAKSSRSRLQNAEVALDHLRQHGVDPLCPPKLLIADTPSIMTRFLWSAFRHHHLRYRSGRELFWMKSLRRWLSETVGRLVHNLELNDWAHDFTDGVVLATLLFNFKPSAVDMSKVHRKNARENLELAFAGFEKHFGVPRILDVTEVMSWNVDQLSVMIYLSLVHSHVKRFHCKPSSFRTLGDHLDEYEANTMVKIYFQGFKKLAMRRLPLEQMMTVGQVRRLVVNSSEAAERSFSISVATGGSLENADDEMAADGKVSTSDPKSAQRKRSNKKSHHIPRLRRTKKHASSPRSVGNTPRLKTKLVDDSYELHPAESQSFVAREGALHAQHTPSKVEITLLVRMLTKEERRQNILMLNKLLLAASQSEYADAKRKLEKQQLDAYHREEAQLALRRSQQLLTGRKTASFLRKS